MKSPPTPSAFVDPSTGHHFARVRCGRDLRIARCDHVDSVGGAADRAALATNVVALLGRVGRAAYVGAAIDVVCAADDAEAADARAALSFMQAYERRGSQPPRLNEPPRGWRLAAPGEQRSVVFDRQTEDYFVVVRLRYQGTWQVPCALANSREAASDRAQLAAQVVDALDRVARAAFMRAAVAEVCDSGGFQLQDIRLAVRFFRRCSAKSAEIDAHGDARAAGNVSAARRAHDDLYTVLSTTLAPLGIHLPSMTFGDLDALLSRLQGATAVVSKEP
jgi:hypothetical protein